MNKEYIIIYNDKQNKHDDVYFCQGKTLIDVILQFSDYIGCLKITQNLFKKAIANMTNAEIIQFYNDINTGLVSILSVLTNFTNVLEEEN